MAPRRRSAGRQRHSRLPGAASRTPRAERRRGGMPAAGRHRRCRCPGRDDLGSVDAPRTEVEAGIHGPLRRTGGRADGGSPRAAFPGAPHDPAVVRVGCIGDVAHRRARAHAAAAVHQVAPTRPPIASAIRRCSRGPADRSPRRPPGCTSRRSSSSVCAARGIERAAITLHVGYGTFKPVKVDRVEDHGVDPEPYTISAAAALPRSSRARGRPPRDCRRHDHDACARGCRPRAMAASSRPGPRWPRCSSIPASRSRSSTG